MPEKEVRLIDANEIVKVAEHAYEQWNLAMVGADTNAQINKVFKRQYLCKVVKAIAKNCPTIDPESLRPQWISVKDRLPEQCGMGCLLCATNCYGQQRVFEGFTGYMEGGKFQWHTNLKDVDLDVWNVTHWMPLPEPPEESESNWHEPTED